MAKLSQTHYTVSTGELKWCPEISPGRRIKLGQGPTSCRNIDITTNIIQEWCYLCILSWIWVSFDAGIVERTSLVRKASPAVRSRDPAFFPEPSNSEYRRCIPLIILCLYPVSNCIRQPRNIWRCHTGILPCGRAILVRCFVYFFTFSYVNVCVVCCVMMGAYFWFWDIWQNSTEPLFVYGLSVYAVARNIWRTRGSKTRGPRTPRLVTGGFIDLFMLGTRNAPACDQVNKTGTHNPSMQIFSKCWNKMQLTAYSD